MAEDSGDKTEKPTPKKLQDARKKGDVAKSRDLTSTAGLLLALLLAIAVLPLLGRQITALIDACFAVMHEPFANALPRLAHQALMTLLLAIGLVAVPLALWGVLVEFVQIGPVLTTEKFKPKGENISPAQGFKRVFSMNNLVELVKSILKTVVVGSVAWLAFKSILPQLPLLLGGEAAHMGSAMWHASWTLLTWVVGVFVLVSAADVAWQRYSFTKKMRMSLRDIRQEHKDAQGDPHVRGQRQQLQQEWAQQGANHAASEAHVLVVNPTHVAIALHFEFSSTANPPTVKAKAVNDAALAMRKVAQGAGVPVLRNVDLARQLLAEVNVGEVIPGNLHNIIAVVILWAQEVRNELDKVRTGEQSPEAAAQAVHRCPPPGEDLTQYDIGPYRPAANATRQHARWMRYVPRRWRRQPPSTTSRGRA